MFDFKFRRWHGAHFETVKIGKPAGPAPPHSQPEVQRPLNRGWPTEAQPTSSRIGVATEKINKDQMVKMTMNEYGFFNVEPWTIDIKP